MSSTPKPIHTHSLRTHRFHLLDGLRGLAAILVVGRHAPPYLASLLTFPNNFLAVDFFFNLSGFVVAFAYEKRLDDGLGLMGFTFVRLVRLYPMYIVGTLFSIVYGIAVIHMLREPGLAHGRVILAIIPALLLLPNLAFQWAPSLFPLDIPAWSLFYEVVANVAFAFLTLRKASKTWFLVGICAASFVGMILLRDHGDECLNGGVIRTTAWLGLARVGFSFFCGVLLFRLTQHRAATLIKGARAYFGSIAIALLLCASLILSWWVTKSGIYEFIAVGLIFPSIVYFAAQLDVPQRVARICIFLGEISYPLYMIHSPLFTPLYGKVFVNAAQRYPILRLYLLPVYVLCLVILSWILARNYDAPVRRLLMQFYNRRLASSNG